MPDLPLVRFRFFGQGCDQEPTGHIVLSWKADLHEWRLVDWLRSNGQRTVLTGDDPNNGARKFLQGLTEFIDEWHKAQQKAITTEVTWLRGLGPNRMLEQKGFRPQTTNKRWWVFKTKAIKEVTHIEKSVADVLVLLRQWLPDAALSVPEMQYPDPWLLTAIK